MSICEAINDLCDEGQLFRLEPGALASRSSRIMCVSHELNLALTKDWDDPINTTRWGHVLNRLLVFLEGGVIRVRTGKMTKRDKADMVRLLPPGNEVWEFRYLERRADIRIFGRFAEPDFFVALRWEERDALGGQGDQAWDEMTKLCCHDWRTLLPAYPPFSAGSYPHGYLSNALPV
jgi:hypothetical protein